MSRKAFNFYRSYFDVAMELSDKERLAFYDALAKRQFLGEEPALTGRAKFAYISQKYAIDAQVKGWEDKTGTSLKVVEKQEVNTPCQGGTEGGYVAPSVQEKEKEKEKEKEEIKEKLSKDSKKKNDSPEQRMAAAVAATNKRKAEFYDSLKPYVGQYDKDMLRAFFDYWSEQNKSCTQMRFEKQPTWEVAKRLATWNKRDTFKNQNNNKSYEQTATRTRKKLY